MDLKEIPFRDEQRQLAEKLMAAVPDKGPIGNMRLRKQLRCSDDAYWEIRNVLINHGLLTKGGGKGGSVRLAFERSGNLNTSEDPGEQALYTALRETLHASFAQEKRFQRASVAIVANHGKRAGGQWEHPDLVLGGFRVLPYVYGNQMDLFSFEVKRNTAAVRDVYEAVSHRRFVHYSYLLVCEAPKDYDWGTISALAAETGVGLLAAPLASQFDDWDELVEPVRHDPDPSRLNDFLASRVSEDFRRTWRSWLQEDPHAIKPFADAVL